MTQSLIMPGGDPAALELLAGQLEAAAAGVDNLAGNTRQVTAGIRTTASWTGEAADSYTAFTGNLSSGVGVTQAPLEKIASAVRDYAGSLRTAQNTVAAYSSAARVADTSGQTADVTAAIMAGQDAQSALAAQQAAGDTAAAAVRAATDEMQNPFGPDGPVRSWIERIHVPWDSLAGDAAVARFLANVKAGEEMAEQASTFAKALPGLMRKDYDTLDAALKATDASWDDQVSATLRMADDYEAIWEWNQGLLEAGEAATKGANLVHGVAVGADVLALAGDVYTEIRPEDTGAMAWVDRSVAGVNGVAAGTDMAYTIAAIAGSSLEIPVAGEVILIGSGLYLGGDYLYHHWTPFRDVSNDVGHATVADADAVGHVAATGAKDLWHGITSIF
jgi:uncharacterized protein YukE